MLYLIDANVLIQANQDYYPLDRVPQYWDWLIAKGKAGEIKIPQEIWGEIAHSGRGTPLRDWVKESDVKVALILVEEVKSEIINHVINEAYAPDMTGEEFEQAGCDPFLIAYAMAEKNRTVVTKENSRRTQKRGKRKIPDACSDLGVNCMDDFKLYRELKFRTG